jgi:hypothetical protein
MKTEQFSSTQGVSTLRVGGSVYHNIGSIFADDSSKAKFMQCFFHSENNDSNNWENVTPTLLEILAIIRRYLLDHNSFIRSLKTCVELYNNYPQYKLVISEDARPQNAPTRTYNAPTSTEVAAIVITEGSDEVDAPSKRDIVIHARTNGPLQRISSTHSSYDSLSYVITHFYADKGWTFNIPQRKHHNNEWIINTQSKFSILSYFLMFEITFYFSLNSFFYISLNRESNNNGFLSLSITNKRSPS